MMEVHHASTLSQKVIDAIYTSLRSVSEYKYSHHAKEQKDSKMVAHWKHILANGKLIEFKLDREFKKHRALLRTNDGHCAVFCWQNAMVITTWYNSPDDKHYTIKPEQYVNGVKYLI